MSATGSCELCGRTLEPHGHYLVRIDVLADPSAPPLSPDSREAGQAQQTIAQLLAEMAQMSADELQDQVHRRFEYRICPRCQKRFLANPLGKPRNRGDDRN